MGNRTSRLIILSDLWGREKSDWLQHYTPYLQSDFKVVYHDCCELGGIDKVVYTEESLHQQLVGGGIDKAVNNLLQLEQEKVHILAFSIGGTIAWKYGLASGNIESLVCVSSTRLRHEVHKPTGRIALFYGSEDGYSPSEGWFDQMSLKQQLINNKGHQVYMEKECSQIVKQVLVGFN